MAAISIHAPRAGCDSFPDRSIHDLRYFNPRTPCGVRPRYADACRDRRVFQSTHPVRGATACINVGYPVIDISIHAPRAGCDFLCQFPIHPTKIFQSTHPVRGATGCSRRRSWSQCNFNPRTPCGVRLHGFKDFFGVVGISIHAPRAGCDALNWMPTPYPCGFQSTHPVRGATLDRGDSCQF